MSNPTPVPPPLPIAYASSATPTGMLAPNLTPEQIGELGLARGRMKKIRRAVRFALFDGWTTGIFGGLTMLGSFGSWSGLLLGAAMVTLAWRQVRAARRLGALDPTAPNTLATGALVLAGVLTIYAGWCILVALRDPNIPMDLSSTDPQVAQLLDGYVPILRQLYFAIYGALIAIACIGGLLTAHYYRSRSKPLQAHLAETPPWLLNAIALANDLKHG